MIMPLKSCPLEQHNEFEQGHTCSPCSTKSIPIIRNQAVPKPRSQAKQVTLTHGYELIQLTIQPLRGHSAMKVLWHTISTVTRDICLHANFPDLVRIIPILHAIPDQESKYHPKSLFCKITPRLTTKTPDFQL